MFFRPLIFTSVLLLAPLRGVAQDPSGVSARARPAVVTVRACSAAGHALRMGSGFYLPDGRIATSSYVVHGASRIEVLGEGGQVGSTLYAEALDEQGGLVILPRIGTPPGTLPLATALPTAGEPVVVLMGPGNEGSSAVSAGNVAAIREMGGRTLLQITGTVSEGASGGPVLNASGQVVGVSMAHVTLGPGLSFAVPAPRALALARRGTGRIAFSGDEAAPGATQSAAGASQATAGSARVAARPTGRRPSPERSSPNVPSLPQGEPISVGQTVQGRLASSDFRRSNGTFADGYRLRGAAGEHVTVTLRSRTFDTWLMVTSPDGRFAQGDDDGGGGTDSQLLLRLPYTGEYVILANTLLEGQTGEYTLSIERGSVPADAEAAIAGRRWERIFSNNGRVYFVDLTGIVPLGTNRYSAWVRVDYPEALESRNGARYDRDIQHWHVECEPLRWRLREFSKYLGGRRVEHIPAMALFSWSDARPNTEGGAVVIAVCEASVDGTGER